MPDPQPLTVTGKNEAGEEVTITLDGPPSGLLLESDFETRFNERFKQRATSLEKTAREKAIEAALEDEEFRSSALKKWGIDGKPKNTPDPERIAALEQDWTKKHVDPLKEQNESLRSRVDRLLGTRLNGEILAHAKKHGIKEEFLETPEGADEPMIVAVTRRRFGHHDESDAFYVRGDQEDEFAFSTKAQQGRKTPYQTVDEFFESFAADKKNAKWVNPQQQRGPKHRGGPGGGPDVYISKADARDHQKYKAAEKQAGEQGGRVIEMD